MTEGIKQIKQMNMNKTTPQQFQVKLGEYGVKRFSNHVRRPSIGCFVTKIYTIVLSADADFISKMSERTLA